MAANKRIVPSRRSVRRRDFLKAGVRAGLAAWAVSGTRCASTKRVDHPNVLLITLDTTRADRLSCYGYERATSPSLDRLAEECMVYTSAVSSSSWTLPAHATLFTGKFVASHGARYDPEGELILTRAIAGPEAWSNYRARSLSPDETTLADVLTQSGYATGAVVAGPWMKKVFGLSKGFQYYDDDGITKLEGRRAPEVTDRALEWLRDKGHRPYFLFLNYFDPHSPYAPPEDFGLEFLAANVDASRFTQPSEKNRRRYQNAMYDAEIAYMDRSIGALLKGLRKLRVYDDTLVVVTADHGELLGEHEKWGHGASLYEEELHVPLFVKHPRGEIAPAASDLRVQITDVPALILERIGLAGLPQAQGECPPDVTHPVVAEVYPLPYFYENIGSIQALYDQSHKLVLHSRGEDMLFDLEGDPSEEHNLAEREPERVARMSETLATYLAGLPKAGAAGPARPIDEETREALEGAGYL